MFMNKYFIPEMQLTEKVNKISSITNWKITQKDKLITSEQKQWYSSMGGSRFLL